MDKAHASRIAQSHELCTRNVNNSMLVLARESRGLSQSELAKRLEVTQGKISKYESGMLDVSDDDLQRIAHVLEYPLAFFFLTDTVEGFGTSCLYHRKRQSLPVKELRVIHAMVNVIRIHLVRLLKSVEIDNVNSFDRMDIDEHDGNAEKIAQLVRAAWKLPLGPIKSLVSAIENAGGIVIQYDFGTRKIDAVSHWPRCLPPLFFVNRDLPVDRWRFTLAHELGHLIMHRVPSPDAEREADRFASEFLMPAREIKHELESLDLPAAARLKPCWRVSIQSLVKRAYELGQITRSRYTTMYTHLSRLGFRRHEPEPLAPEKPTVIADLMNVHTRNYGYSVPQLCALAVSCEEPFRRLFLHHGEPHRLRVVSG